MTKQTALVAFPYPVRRESRGFVGRWQNPSTAYGQLTPGAQDHKRRGRDRITSERDSVAAG